MNTVTQRLITMNPDKSWIVKSNNGKTYDANLSRDLTSDDLTDCSTVEVYFNHGTPYIVKGNKDGYKQTDLGVLDHKIRKAGGLL